MKRTVMPIILALFSVNMALSQDMPKVMPPSPNASAFAQYADVPTNNYTGVPDISIPLYNIKSGDIELPLSLSYHASGIRVAQEASNVGLGWALNAGGVITRSVNGIDDLKPFYGYTVVDELPTTSSDQIIIGPNMERYYDYKDINSGLRDGKPDVLYYSFLGESGKMIFDKRPGGSNKIKGIPLKQTNSTFVYDVDKGEWEVTNGNGWKYYFNVKEVSRGYAGNPTSASSYLVDEAQRLESFDRLDHSVNYDEYISGWFINKITTPKGESITFEYDGELGRESIGQLAFYEQESYYGSSLYKSSESYSWHGSFGEKKYPVAISMSASDNLNLKKIRFKNGYIEFNTSDREDLRPSWFFGTYSAKPQKLSSFEVFNLNGQSIKKIEFNYSYFDEGVAVAKNKENYWRLKLNSLQESVYDNITSTYKKNPPHTFTYNSMNLPAKTSASVDHWGYFNGADNDHIRNYEDVTQWSYIQNPIVVQNPNLPQDQNTYQSFLPHQIECGPSSSSTWFPFLNGAYREPDEIKMQAGILNKITYPTGGATKFTYEPNKFDPNGDISIYKYEWRATSVWHDGDDVDDDVKTFNLNDYTIVRIGCGINNSGSLSQLANIKASIQKSGIDVIRFSPSINSFYKNVQLILPPGSYTVKANTHAPTGSVTISMNISYLQPMAADGLIGAGLRISKQEGLDTDGTVKMKSVYDYTYNGSGWTSGIAMSDIQHYYLDGGNRTYTNPQGYSYAFNDVVVRSSENNVPLSSSAQGNYVGYSEVSVSKEDQSGNRLGKSIYTYSNNPDETPYFHLPGVPVTTHMNNGDLIKEEHYNAQSGLLKSVENQYVKDQLSSKIIKGIVAKTTLKDPPSGTFAGMFTNVYRIYSEWWHLNKTIEKNYANGVNPVTMETTYAFENPVHKNLTKSTTVNSKGETVETVNKYPQDLSSGFDETSSTVISGMIGANIINPILKTETKVNGGIVQGTLTNYKTESGTYFPLNIKSQKPGSASVFDKRIEFIDYNDNGKILSVSKPGGAKISYKWGYDQQYPIAEITNASQNEFYHQNFEDGEIDYDGSLVYDNTKAHTGKYSGRLTNPNTTEMVSHSTKRIVINQGRIRKFTFSGWVYSDAPSVQLFLFMMKPGETAYNSYYDHMQTTVKNKWTYMQKDFEVPADVYEVFLRLDNNSVGNVWFDDLRIQPSDSQMSTNTYQPLVGMISTIDNSGKTVYYEYDSFQRLKNIKDQNNNIVKSYDYHYKP